MPYKLLYRKLEDNKANLAKLRPSGWQCLALDKSVIFQPSRSVHPFVKVSLYKDNNYELEIVYNKTAKTRRYSYSSFDTLLDSVSTQLTLLE